MIKLIKFFWEAFIAMLAIIGAMTLAEAAGWFDRPWHPPAWPTTIEANCIEPAISRPLPRINA